MSLKKLQEGLLLVTKNEIVQNEIVVIKKKNEQNKFQAQQCKQF